jgi:hypothetical protein
MFSHLRLDSVGNPSRNRELLLEPSVAYRLLQPNAEPGHTANESSSLGRALSRPSAADYGNRAGCERFDTKTPARRETPGGLGWRPEGACRTGRRRQVSFACCDARGQLVHLLNTPCRVPVHLVSPKNFSPTRLAGPPKVLCTPSARTVRRTQEPRCFQAPGNPFGEPTPQNRASSSASLAGEADKNHLTSFSP